ncbi:Pycsar system effector family protein [Pseudacidovorax sp. NFM-22]|uniref:Pycsar system effector family protein n=1 Tax=Pseudacidovorax sp. NFM-22 TaxID=2744469 RepID=UPI001F3550A6|nr:Pycsar system effector family protein [Pseudacidovorax sp. NFM-22]
MPTIEQQLSAAQWMFERQLYWIAQAELKVAAVVTIDIAMLGGLFAAWTNIQSHPAWSVLLASACVGLLCAAVLCGAMCLMPRTLPAEYISGLYFGQIAEIRNSADFADAHRLKTQQQLLDDWLRQVHRNAQIATLKHSWVRKSLIFSFLGAACWVGAVAILVKI